MYKKVLISDDLDTINHGVVSVANSLGIADTHQVQYCDDAYLKIKKGVQDENPFELLITDLSYKSDHRAQKISSGEALIQVLHKEHPELKIIVYSIEDRIQKVRHLTNSYNLSGFVCKGRKGMVELEEAIKTTAEGNRYLSPKIQNALGNSGAMEIDDYDIELLRLLSKGKSQDEISAHFKEWEVTPSSLSSIEKRLNKLRIEFQAKNAIQLVAVAKDMGII
jgi:DNA-binding NarL/FixJ family response regulator